MAFVLPGRSSLSGLRPDTQCISSDQPCHYCGAIVGHYQPMLLFGLDQPAIMGAAHPECAYFDFRYAQFGVTADPRLSPSDISLLAHFYVRLYQLPGEGSPQAPLRRCLAAMLPDYPTALMALPDLIACFIEENRPDLAFYQGDLETDFYVFLGQVQRAAQSKPLNARVDFS